MMMMMMMMMIRTKVISISVIQMKTPPKSTACKEHLLFLIFEGSVLIHSAFGLYPASK